MEERTDWSAHTMHERDRCIGKCLPSKHGARHHRGACIAIAAIMKCRPQIRTDQAHCPQRLLVRKGICLAADIGFDCMCQRINSRIGCRPLRQAQRQFEIDNRCGGHKSGAHTQHFFIGQRICDHRHPGRLRTRARRCWNGDHWQCCSGNDIGDFQSLHGALRSRAGADRLGCIYGATTTKRDQTIIPARREHAQGRFNALHRGFWHGLEKPPGPAQQRFHLTDIAEICDNLV